MKLSTACICVLIAVFFLLFGGVMTEVGNHIIGGTLLGIGAIFTVCAGIGYLDAEEEKMITNRRYY